MASRKDNSLTISFVSQVVGIPVLLLLLVFVPPSELSVPDVAWGLLAGLFQIVALRLLWQALAVGAMGLLGAINAFTGAIVPAFWVAFQGSGFGVLGWMGAAIGLVAMVLVARRPGDEGVLATHRSSALKATAAGTLFGLGYICLTMPAEESSVVPLLAMRISATALGGALRVAAGHRRWLSRDNRTLGYLPGLFGCASLIGFVVAVHLDEVAATSVVQALAPLATAVLAYVFLGQKLRHVQAVGFVLALGATILLAID